MGEAHHSLRLTMFYPAWLERRVARRVNRQIESEAEKRGIASAEGKRKLRTEIINRRGATVGLTSVVCSVWVPSLFISLFQLPLIANLGFTFVFTWFVSSPIADQWAFLTRSVAAWVRSERSVYVSEPFSWANTASSRVIAFSMAAIPVATFTASAVFSVASRSILLGGIIAVGAFILQQNLLIAALDDGSTSTDESTATNFAFE